MNISTKCNCCVSEVVCKYKELYENGVESILHTNISDTNGGYWRLKDCPHIEVSVRCPHMVPASQSRFGERRAEE